MAAVERELPGPETTPLRRRLDRLISIRHCRGYPIYETNNTRFVAGCGGDAASVGLSSASHSRACPLDLSMHSKQFQADDPRQLSGR
ncbi:MAG: hypothetical protein ACR2MK_01225 [Solirubrobacteraceae bacterium]